MALRKPTFCPATYTNPTDAITISRNGAHQAALRRRSVKVFDGAMKALMMRAPSESEAGWEAGMGSGDLGKTGAAAIMPPSNVDGILVGRQHGDKHRS